MKKLTLDEIKALESRHVVQTYKRQPVAFVRGSGSRLYDVDGREYLDLVSGIGVTSHEPYRGPFQPLIGPVTFVPAGDVTALKAAVAGKTAAVIAEPIQGEGGIRPLSREFAQAINDVCRSTGALYIADEVQTGLG